ncbi:hypothetical protein EDD37DRAFT_651841 [Exophiala viscosa]|uniref:Uncharacterized protein n=1 Tax=Exophiala viscosa TaxID=2486360 RepID=A0AAN6DYH8_9EURO|nr:hypothetical protein EDD36DRAFT_417729 [Exophiala viscosa]KAI1622569.1 hypothetical protein EDD37DRAFT_651841 [Exophiala viscosa]
MHTTKAIIRRYAGRLLHLYPRRNASFDEHADAQIYRVDARSNEDEHSDDHVHQRVKASKENYENFNITLPTNEIDALDWAYDISSDCHYEAEDPEQELSVTQESVEKTIEKYPEVVTRNSDRDNHVRKRVEPSRKT